MKPLLPQRPAALALFASLTFSAIRPEAAAQDVKEQSLRAPHGVSITVRMEGPYTADTPLQVVCYFRYIPGPRQADARGAGRAGQGARRRHRRAPGAGRVRGQSSGDAAASSRRSGSIKAKALLLVGLGEEDSLSLERMETGRASGAAGGVPAGRPPGSLRPADPGSGQLEVRHRRRRAGRRARDAPRLRHGETPPGARARQGVDARGVGGRGRPRLLRRHGRRREAGDLRGGRGRRVPESRALTC